MFKYIAWRLTLCIPTLFAASVVIFVVMRLLPGDVSQVITGDIAVSPEIRASLSEELGLDEPLHIQYGQWVWSMVNGEMGGRSLENKEPLRSIISRQLPVTLLLTTYTIALSILVSLPLALLLARGKNHWLSRLIRLVSLAGLSMPQLWLALLILLGLLLAFRWSPPVIYSTPWTSPWSHFQVLIWPTLILSWQHSAHLIRVTASSLTDAMDQSYVTTARTKGIPEGMILLKHALPNALVPALTMVGLQLGILISGAMVLETIFGIPGIGRGLVHAAQSRDYPVVQSLAILLVFLSLVVNLVVDVACAHANPRARTFNSR